jgi:hypothetical protein
MDKNITSKSFDKCDHMYLIEIFVTLYHPFQIIMSLRAWNAIFNIRTCLINTIFFHLSLNVMLFALFYLWMTNYHFNCRWTLLAEMPPKVWSKCKTSQANWKLIQVFTSLPLQSASFNIITFSLKTLSSKILSIVTLSMTTPNLIALYITT